jgi:hypothetical protein
MIEHLLSKSKALRSNPSTAKKVKINTAHVRPWDQRGVRLETWGRW